MREDDGNRRLDPPFSLFSPIVPFRLPQMTVLSIYKLERLLILQTLQLYYTRLTTQTCSSSTFPAEASAESGEKTTIRKALFFFSCISLFIVYMDR